MQEIDWTAPDALQQIMSKIKLPIETILKADKNIDTSKREEVIFSSTNQINDYLEIILGDIRNKYINITLQEKPVIFEIFDTNLIVQKLCITTLNYNKISKIDQKWLLEFENYISSTIERQQVNLNELAYHLNTSERQLNRKIKKILNLTPNKYIRILRLHKAKQMIENYITDSISQISYAVGYNDVHYFCKLFYNQYSITPKELIDSLQ